MKRHEQDARVLWDFLHQMEEPEKVMAALLRANLPLLQQSLQQIWREAEPIKPWTSETIEKVGPVLRALLIASPWIQETSQTWLRWDILRGVIVAKVNTRRGLVPARDLGIPEEVAPTRPIWFAYAGPADLIHRGDRTTAHYEVARNVDLAMAKKVVDNYLTAEAHRRWNLMS